MDIDKAIRVHRGNIDMDTGEQLSHSEIYGRIIDKLGGVDAVWKCVPFTLEQVQQALKTDEHLNNLPIREWDMASGWISYIAQGREYFAPRHSRLRTMLQDVGITCYSCSQGVCILKECARRKAQA